MTIEQPSTSSPKNIARETFRGTFWGYLSFASGKLLNFVATLILARLLVPEQFGLVAYCTIAIQYLDILNTGGIDSALISRREKVEEAANSAFIANITLGIVSYVIAWLAAPSIALFFKSDEIILLIRTLAIVLPIAGLGLVPSAMIMRSLRFREKLIVGVSQSVSKGLISVVLALMGYGVWSLIWGQIIGEIVSTIVLWSLANWRPSWKFDRSSTIEVMTFGAHIILVEVAGQIRNNVDYLIVGRLLGASVLGAYTLAYRIPELAIRSFDRVIGGVSFPLLAQVQADKDFLKSTYLGYIRYISMFTFSIGVGIAIISRLFVETFLSSKWQATILPMALISIALAIISVGHIPGIFYKAIGRPDILNKLSIIKIPLIVAIIWYAAKWGIVGVGVGQIIFAIISVLLDNFVVSRIIKFNLIDTVKALVPAIVCSISMLFTTIPAMIFFSPSGLIGLLSITLLGFLTFLAVLSFVDRSLVLQAVQFLKKKISRGGGKS
jgi:O-antigen/teichoic acid export membrane protein